MDSLLPISHFKDPSSLDAVTFGQALHVTYAAGAFHFNSFKLEMRAAPGGNANKKKKWVRHTRRLTVPHVRAARLH